MATPTKILVHASFYFVPVFAVCFFFPSGADANHAANPIFFLNFLEDGITPDSNLVFSKLVEDEPSTNPNIENNLITKEIKDSKDVQTKMVDITSPLKSMKLTNSPKNDFPRFEDLTQISLSESQVKTSNEIPVKDNAMSFEADSYIPDSPDYVPIQFHKFYLRAITSLMQYIMDTLFSFNEPTNSRFCEVPPVSPEYDLKPTRKISKRDIPDMDNGLDSGTEFINNATSKESILSTATDKSEKSPPKTANTSETSTMDISTLGSGSHKTSTKGNTETIALSNSTYKIETPKLHENITGLKDISKVNDMVKLENELDKGNENEKINGLVESHKNLHISFISEKAPTLFEEEELAQDRLKTEALEGNQLEEKNHHKSEEEHRNSLNDDLIDDNPPMVLTKSTEDGHEYDEDFNPEFDSRSVKGVKGEKEATSSISSILMVTGTVLIILIIASGGVVAASKMRRQRLEQNQPGNQNSTSQHSTMA